MDNKKKIILSSLGAVGVMSLAAVGVYAYFLDEASATTKLKVGHVSMDGTVEMLHGYKDGDKYVEAPANLNPGDNDPDKPDGVSNGTDHEININYANKGNKSILTRAVITVTGEKGDTSKTPLTTAELKNLIFSLDTTKLGDSAVTGAKLTALKTTEGTNSIGFIVNGDVLSGVGDNAEVEQIDGRSTKDTGLMKINVGLKSTVTETMYYGATIKINVKLQGLQYRNASNEDWATIFEDNVVIN